MELIKYNITDASIQEMNQNCLALKITGIDDKVGYSIVKSNLSNVRKKRIEIEETRKGLNEDAVKYKKKVDGEARRITTLLAPIEAHLKAEKALHESEVAAKKEAVRVAKLAERQSKIDRLMEIEMTKKGGEYLLNGLPFNLEIALAFKEEDFQEFIKDETEIYNTRKADQEKADRVAEEAERLAEEERVKIEITRREQADKDQKLKKEAKALEEEKKEIQKERVNLRIKQLESLGMYFHSTDCDENSYSNYEIQMGYEQSIMVIGDDVNELNNSEWDMLISRVTSMIEEMKKNYKKHEEEEEIKDREFERRQKILYSIGLIRDETIFKYKDLAKTTYHLVFDMSEGDFSDQVEKFKTIIEKDRTESEENEAIENQAFKSDILSVHNFISILEKHIHNHKYLRIQSKRGQEIFSEGISEIINCTSTLKEKLDGIEED